MVGVPNWLVPFQVLPAAAPVVTILVVNVDSVNESRAGSVGSSPDTDAVASAAELVAAMRWLKSWSGLSYRQLERHAAKRGLALPRSTLTNALHRQTLPREDLLAAFVRACGHGEGEVARWVAARRRLAVAGTGGRRPTAPPHAYRPHPAHVVLLTVVLVVTVAAVWLAGG
jgi:hypothetical protein